MSSAILLGAPGSGKGTLAFQLKARWNVAHISTGDMFREAVKAGSPMGLRAAEFMKEGKLVPDDVTIGVVRERFSKDDVKKGFILDGYPRTIAQAEALDKILEDNKLKLHTVVLLNIDEDMIVERITGRRTCSKCASIYHIKNFKSKVDNICDKCGSELIQRRDDTKEVVVERLAAYHKQTAPLVEFYRNKKLLQEIDASRSPEFMMQQVEALGL